MGQPDQPFAAPQGPAPQAPQPGQPGQPGSSPLKIDDALLADLGLGALPKGEKDALRQHIYETLEMRVGMRLADQMTNEQLDEFETYFNAKDDAGAFRWLETNFPNYKDIVADEFNKLKTEVGSSAQQILSASQQQASMPAADPYQPQPAADSYQPAQPPMPDPYQPPQTSQQPPQPPQPSQEPQQWQQPPMPPQYPPQQ